MTDVAASPLRVALVGLGRPGLHLIERFATGGPFRVVAVQHPLPVADIVAPFGVRSIEHPLELVAATDVDVIWFVEHDAFRNSLASTGLCWGKHTIAETPLRMTSAMADKAFADAAQQDRLLLVHHPRRADLDFRQAVVVAQDPEIGAIRAAKFVSWSYGLPPRGAIRGQGPLTFNESDDPQTTKIRFVAHALDQLIPLVRDRPIRVFATGDPNVDGAPDFWAGYSLALQITFERGCQAEIDIRLESPAPFQSGWTLTGERGGYAKERRYTLTDEGEVFDSPVTPAISHEGADQFEWLARQIRCGVRDAAEETRVRTVVAILDAAQRSVEAGQAVSL